MHPTRGLPFGGTRLCFSHMRTGGASCSKARFRAPSIRRRVVTFERAARIAADLCARETPNGAKLLSGHWAACHFVQNSQQTAGGRRRRPRAQGR